MQTRQQYRKELRDVIKSLAKIEKMAEFKEMNLFFQDLKKDDYKLLESNSHTDPKLTLKYSRHMKNMKYYISLEVRRDLLLKGRIHEQNISLGNE